MPPTAIRRPPSRRLARCIAVLGVGALLAACARTLAVESEPGPTYTVEVVNQTTEPLIVSYDDGSGERLLGTVAADDRERFAIASPAARTVTIVATDRDRTRTIRRSASLDPTAPTRIVLSL